MTTSNPDDDDLIEDAELDRDEQTVRAIGRTAMLGVGVGVGVGVVVVGPSAGDGG